MAKRVRNDKWTHSLSEWKCQSSIGKWAYSVYDTCGKSTKYSNRTEREWERDRPKWYLKFKWKNSKHSHVNRNELHEKKKTSAVTIELYPFGPANVEFHLHSAFCMPNITFTFTFYAKKWSEWANWVWIPQKTLPMDID